MQTGRTWIDVSCGSPRQQTLADGAALVLLGTSVLAFAARDILCQLQAYVLLALGICTLALYASNEARYADSSATALRNPYCIDCRKESRAAIVVRPRTKAVRSNYQRMFARYSRAYLLLATWLVWIAYGSLFHSARHADNEDVFVARILTRAWHHWNADDTHSIIALVRHARVFTLALAAFYSVYAESSRGVHHSTSLQTRHWAVRSAAVFFVCLFAPTGSSTPQALDLTSLAARTGAFFALFVVSEALSESLVYLVWVSEFARPHQRLFTGLLMALGQSAPVRPGDDYAADDLVPQGVMDTPTGQSTRGFVFCAPFISGAVVVRSAWVLFADDNALPLALLQLAWMLRLLQTTRSAIEQTVAAKGASLRLRRSRKRRRERSSETVSPRHLEAGTASNVDKQCLDDEARKHSKSSESSPLPVAAEKPQQRPLHQPLRRSAMPTDVACDPERSQSPELRKRAPSPPDKRKERQTRLHLTPL